jgi:exonuclease I
VIDDGQSPKKEECFGINGCVPSIGELARLIPELYVQVIVHRDKLRINNQLDASNIQNLFCHETLHVSGIFCAHYQELSAVHLEIGMFHVLTL